MSSKPSFLDQLKAHAIPVILKLQSEPYYTKMAAFQIGYLSQYLLFRRYLRKSLGAYGRLLQGEELTRKDRGHIASLFITALSFGSYVAVTYVRQANGMINLSTEHGVQKAAAKPDEGGGVFSLKDIGGMDPETLSDEDLERILTDLMEGVGADGSQRIPKA